MSWPTVFLAVETLLVIWAIPFIAAKAIRRANRPRRRRR